jgi:hypothetical protein
MLLPFGLFYGHLLNFVAIWYIAWLIGIVYGHLVYFPRFGMLYKKKSGNPFSNGSNSYRVTNSNKRFT